MSTEFYFEIQYFNLTQKLQPRFFAVTKHSTVHNVTATVGKTQGCAKSENLPTQKYNLTMWY